MHPTVNIQDERGKTITRADKLDSLSKSFPGDQSVGDFSFEGLSRAFMEITILDQMEFATKQQNHKSKKHGERKWHQLSNDSRREEHVEERGDIPIVDPLLVTIQHSVSIAELDRLCDRESNLQLFQILATQERHVLFGNIILKIA